MQVMTDGLAKLNWRVHRFDFPYMFSRRLTGQKSLPDRPEMVLKALTEAFGQVDQDRPLVIGGNTMGGRIASLLLDDLHASSTIPAGVCLGGYPFHPLGKSA